MGWWRMIASKHTAWVERQVGGLPFEPGLSEMGTKGLEASLTRAEDRARGRVAAANRVAVGLNIVYSV